MGTFFGGPHNKDYSIVGSKLGSPYLGKPPSPAPSGRPENPWRHPYFDDGRPWGGEESAAKAGVS